MFRYKRIVLILIALALMIGVILLVWSKHKENVILRQALQQQEQMIKRKDEQIQQLQEQLESLRKEQILREKKIIFLKQKREQIQRPKTNEEVIKAFKELGYDAIIK